MGNDDNTASMTDQCGASNVHTRISYTNPEGNSVFDMPASTIEASRDN